MKNENCPPQDDLSAFVRCRLSEAEAEAISEHVANCPKCDETVVGLERSGDTVFDYLKGIPVPFPFQNEPERARMAQAAKQHPPGNDPSPSDDPPSVGALEQLRDYRIIEKIGEGGMGTVYRAVHTRLNKTVALKVLSSRRPKDESAISRFQREMSIVGRLQHPNIVQAYDAGEENGQHFLVMEYVAGTDLSEIVRQRGPLPVHAACEVIAQAAVGLQYAHENGLVHRDIKPSNLMLSVSSDKRSNEVSAAIVKILDLGLARLHTDDKENGRELTTDGQMMGTLDYMAPEQGGDSHAVDTRADIYSLGATFYKLLTGEAPFAGAQHRSVMQKLTALATKPAPSVRERRPEVPERLAAIISRMLSKQPQDRYSTPAEVASALQPFRAGAELPAMLGLSNRPSDSVPPSPTVQLASSDQLPGTRRPFAAAAKWFIGAVALFAIILTVTTKQGTIEVESPDGQLPDDVKVVVSRGGDSLEVLQADNQWRASVAGGNVQLAVQGGDDRFELQDSTLTVSRFGKSVVTLRVKQATPAPVVANQQEATDPDRRAAEYVLSVSGSISIKDKNQERQSWAVDDLPRTDFELTAVDLQRNQQVTDSGLASFQDCRNLTRVTLGPSANVSDAGLAYFRDCRNLKHLDLNSTKVSDEGLAFFTICQNLEFLELDSCNVGSSGLAHFQKCENLVHIGLGLTRVSDADLKYFRHCQKLKDLGLRNTQVSDAGLAHLKDCKSIEQLHLDATNVTDAGVERFADWPKLVSVAVRNTKVTEAGVKKLSAALPGCTIVWDGGVIEPTASPDRRAAEYVLSIGGTVTIKEKYEARDVATVGDLPLTPFVITWAQLPWNEAATDSGLASFQDCKNLTHVNFSVARNVGDVGLACLRDCKNIISLDLQATKVTDEGLANFKHCKQLESLQLHGCKFGDEGLAHFQDCPNLWHLGLGYSYTSDAGLTYFKKCQKLTQLGLSYTRVTDAGLPHFKDWKNLELVDLAGTKVSDAGLANFKDCKNLATLCLTATQVSDAGLDDLANCSNLRDLQITMTNVTEAGVKKLSAALPECTIEWNGGMIEPMPSTSPDRRAAEYVLSTGGWVTIQEKYEERSVRTVGDLPLTPFVTTWVQLAWNETVTDSGLASFQDCKNLTHVDFGVARNVGDVGLAYFRDCKDITHLGVNSTKVTDAGLAIFKHCKKLEFLELHSCKVGDEGLAHFQDCPNLLHLGLGFTYASDAGLAYFKQCQKLTVLNLLNTQVTDAGLAHFKDCKNLEHVNLANTKVTDAGLAHIKQCQKLTVLVLLNTQVSDTGLAHFRDCKNLHQVSLANTKVTDAGLAHFKDCKNLHSLDMATTQVSDAGLAAHFKDLKNLTELTLSTTQVSDVTLELLTAFPNLRHLQIEQTKVTEAGVKKLAVALSECRIIWDGGVIEPAVSPDRRAAE